MNDRAQGGSVSNDTIEIMMQRRQYQKDKFNGFDEVLNEVDSNDIGIKVSAQYFM